MLKVRELVAQLQELDQNLPVVLQADPEGNGYFWVNGVDDDGYVEEGDLESDRLESVPTAEDLEGENDGDGDSYDGYKQVVTIYP